MGVIELKNVMLNENVDIKVIDKINKLAHAFGYTHTLFVSSAGDNSDGLSWATAYNSLITALDYVNDNQSTGESHLIMIGVGTFDMDTTGDPEYRGLSIGLIGMGRNNTFITNDHATATAILMFDGCELIISNLTFHTGNNNITGLKLEEDVGGLGHGTIIDDVEFHVYTPTGAHSLLYLQSDVEGLSMTNCWFYGNVTHTTGIFTDDATYNYYSNLHFQTCLIGIHLSDGDDQYNHFKDIYFGWCDTCIQIDIATTWGNYFENIHFIYTYTTNISDAAGSTNYYHNLTKTRVAWEEQEEFYPADLTGIPVTAGVGLNVYSAADVVIKTGAASTEPYYVKGFAYIAAVNTEIWAVRFTVGGATALSTTSIVGGSAAELRTYYFKRPFFVRQGDTLECAVKSVTGSNVMNIWAIIENM